MKNENNNVNPAAENQEPLTTEVSLETIDTTQTGSPEQGASSEEEDASTPTTSIDVIENFLSRRYNFRFNDVTGRLEFKEIDATDFVLATDYKINSLLRELQKNRINTSGSALRAILNSDFSARFNPFESYFNSLPVWDGTDHIASLAATVITNNDELWQTCFKKWIVAMVACVLKLDVTNHTVIVFSGMQGIGKTTWILKLIPIELSYYCFSGTINPNNKDTLIQLAECMLINLDELENLNRTEIGSLKELITKDAIRIRRAYGYFNENLPRRASFAGSVNTKEFLNDTTGSRRFLCFEVSSIDYEFPVDLKQVYAQAFHLLNTGFKHWFDKHENKQITQNNEQYRIFSIEEELLLTYYEPVEEKNATLYLTATDLATVLAQKTKFTISESSKQRLGRALKKHKFSRIKRKTRYVYALKEKDVEIVDYQSRYLMQADKLE